MTDQTNQGASSQAASGQSSSNSTGQSNSGQQDSAAQGGASDQGQQSQNRATIAARPAYVLESEYNAATGEIDHTKFGERVNGLSAFKAEQDVRKNSLPASPDKYEIKLPADFKAPEGVKFEFDMNDPGLKQVRELAHARGLDQEALSGLLGIYAANKIGEQQKLGVAKNAEMSKLGSAAQARIDAVETWLKARVGTKADVLVAQMKNYPVAAMVETFEDVIRQFSNQGSANFDQRGRAEQEQQTSIPKFDGSNFAQVRAAQDAANRNAAVG